MILVGLFQLGVFCDLWQVKPVCVFAFLCLLLTGMVKAEFPCDRVQDFFNLALTKLCISENQLFEFAGRKYVSLSGNVL